MRDPEKKSIKPGLHPRTKRSKPTISIIGGGRLGTTLGRALAEHDYQVEAVATLHRASAGRAARLISGKTRPFAASDLKGLPESELILITTPDDVIGAIADQLSRRPNSPAKSPKTRPTCRVVLHASGALSSEVLMPMRRAGFAIGSMHPLVSISDRKAKTGAFQHAFFCLEGDGGALRMARSIVRSLGGESFSLDSRDKPLYHAAAVMASGHVTALVDIAMEMLIECGLSKLRARSVLAPLLQSNVLNLLSQMPARALTGTFARGDADTTRRHLAAIRAHHLDDALAAYAILGKRSLELASQNGMDQKALVEIRQEIDQTLKLIQRAG
ncbi:MAG: DUF2520 domain-containing protein [Pyrinomonadaceae bacterium]